MRIIALLLSVVLIVSPAMAVKPAKSGASVEETLKYINERLYVSQDYSNTPCRDVAQLSLSQNHDQIILEYLLVDGRDRVKASMPPRYVYHLPVLAVRKIYPWGRWTTNDRVVVRTSGRAVTKYGPVWDCDHGELRSIPKERFLDSMDLMVQEPYDEHLNQVIKALNQLLKLLQAEASSKADPLQKTTPAPDRRDSSPNQP